ncbi:hypothetical protein ACLOJK_004224, partial [Asimina triloba]
FVVSRGREWWVLGRVLKTDCGGESGRFGMQRTGSEGEKAVNSWWPDFVAENRFVWCDNKNSAAAEGVLVWEVIVRDSKNLLLQSVGFGGIVACFVWDYLAASDVGFGLCHNGFWVVLQKVLLKKEWKQQSSIRSVVWWVALCVTTSVEEESRTCGEKSLM